MEEGPGEEQGPRGAARIIAGALDRVADIIVARKIAAVAELADPAATVRKDAAGAVTTYAYDRTGRLVQAASPDAELVHQHDRRGLLKTELVDGQVTTYA